jgi:hypothetical protein
VLKLAAVTAFSVWAFFVLRDQANHHPPPLAGDVWEYWVIAESLDRHGSPELQPGDIDPVVGEPPRYYYPPPPPKEKGEIWYAYETAPDGRSYGTHFWGYAFCGVPAKRFLRYTERSQLGWPGLSNAMWFVLAIGVVLFVSRAPVVERCALAALAAAGPAWVYVGWPGPELYSWAFVLVSVSMYRDRRYVLSGVAVGLSAMQNPPVLIFGAVPVLAAVLERRWNSALASALGGALGLIPFGFFYYHFGKPNLIVEDNNVSPALISWVRTWSQIADFNQGLLAYVPLLVVGAAVGAARLVATRDRHGLVLVGGAVAVALGTQVSRNWNSGCDGLQRYLVWMLPLWAGVAVAGIGGRWRLWAFVVLAVGVHASLVAVYRHYDPDSQGNLGHGPLAKWVLNNYPQAYWVEPEIFVERTRHADDWLRKPSRLPVGYSRPDGTISKMLVDPRDLDAVTRAYETDPEYLTALRAEAVGRSGPFFAHPPRGTVRLRPPPRAP